MNEDLPREPEAPSVAWMVTFTDLVSLMLTFFVMLFSMSSVKVDVWEKMIDALNRTVDPVEIVRDTPPSAPRNIAKTFRKRAINLDYLNAVLRENIAGDEILGESRINMMADRMVISLPGRILFDANSAVLRPEARDAVFRLGGILRNVGNQLAVGGHTDPVPPENSIFPSNWELSLARAGSVANELNRAGYADSIYAFGFAAGRFADIADVAALNGDTAYEAARRVDIIVLQTVQGGY
jgi:chemotaxis protein MotB